MRLPNNFVPPKREKVVPLEHIPVIDTPEPVETKPVVAPVTERETLRERMLGFGVLQDRSTSVDLLRLEDEIYASMYKSLFVCYVPRVAATPLIELELYGVGVDTSSSYTKQESMLFPQRVCISIMAMAQIAYDGFTVTLDKKAELVEIYNKVSKALRVTVGDISKSSYNSFVLNDDEAMKIEALTSSMFDIHSEYLYNKSTPTNTSLLSRVFKMKEARRDAAPTDMKREAIYKPLTMLDVMK